LLCSHWLRSAAPAAWSLESLLVARTLAGARRQRPDEREHRAGALSIRAACVGRGFGHNALVVATAFTLGPTIASGILALGTWPWLFAVNLPFGLIALAIGFKTLPPTPRAVHAFDFIGAALAAGCLGLFIIGIGSAAHKAPIGLVCAEIAAALLSAGS